MASATRRATAVVALTAAALALAACGGSSRSGTGSSRSRTSTIARVVPRRIVHTPKRTLAVAEPQSNGIMWVLAGRPATGLFEIDSPSGHVVGSVSVSGAAHSVAESTPGVLGLALGTTRSGALELLDGRTAKVIRTVRLPAPARDVTLGSDGTTFYVLTGWATSASVTIVDSQNGRIRGTVPVPADAVSIAPDVQQALLYVLQRSGKVSQISISDGKVSASFSVGHDPGRSLALSPDGGTLYVLKGTSQIANVAVVDVATESVHRVLPAPSHCVQVLVSPSGNQLYEVVGTPGYGNIQIFSV
jgi:DNA-binding beta-propeller fold protein YncE